MVDSGIDKELYEAFIDETNENIELIEKGILKLEKDPENEEIINDIFRRYHTIKGAAAFMNYKNLSKYTHLIENLLTNVRGHKIKITDKIMLFLINSIKTLKMLLDNNDYSDLIDFDKINIEIEDLKKASGEIEENRFQYIKLDRKEDEEETMESIETNKYLIFNLAKVNFGINLSVIDEITQDIEGVELPFVERHIFKLINIRGELIPVVDLRMRFNLKPKNNILNRIIIVKFYDARIGLKVDYVEKILKIKSEEILPFNRRLKDFNTDYIKGVYSYNHQPIIILKLEKILERKEVKNNEQ